MATKREAYYIEYFTTEPVMVERDVVQIDDAGGEPKTVKMMVDSGKTKQVKQTMDLSVRKDRALRRWRQLRTTDPYRGCSFHEPASRKDARDRHVAGLVTVIDAYQKRSIANEPSASSTPWED